MQNKLFIFKLKSLKYPKTKWESVGHFLYTHEDRQIKKDEKPLLIEANYSKKYAEANGCILNFMQDNELYKLQCYTQELHDIANRSYFLPHQEKGIWEYTELMSINVSPEFSKDLKKAERKFT